MENPSVYSCGGIYPGPHRYCVNRYVYWPLTSAIRTEPGVLHLKEFDVLNNLNFPI